MQRTLLRFKKVTQGHDLASWDQAHMTEDDILKQGVIKVLCNCCWSKAQLSGSHTYLMQHTDLCISARSQWCQPH